VAKKIINVVYDVNDKELTDAKKKIVDVEKETKKSEEGFKKLGTTAGKAWGLIASAAAAIGLASIAKQIFDITAEFQKLSAVLTNTLGSRSQAQQALKTIKDFAAQTPFSVVELTDSFVKLANQGFKPTIVELRKLGDLASSQGKAFDQLTEAIIDAQTGEFERLKEFGIRASKEGDNVTFTFKGVQTQTEFTSKAIREYILALGDAQGVSGSMAAISETLGGRVSNLGDSWDSLLNTIGDGNSGILASTISLLSEIITNVNELVKTSQQLSEEYRQGVVGTQLEAAKAFAQGFKDQNVALEAFAKNLEREAEKINQQYGDIVQKQIDGQKTVSETIFGLSEARKQELITLENSRRGLGDQYIALIQSAEAIREQIRLTEDQKRKDEEAAAAAKKNTKEIKEKRRALKEIAEDDTDKKIDAALIKVLELQNAPAKARNETLSELNKGLESHVSSFIKSEEKLTEETRKAEEERTRIREEAADRRKRIEEESTEVALEATRQLLYAQFLSRDEDLASEQAYFDQQMILAGDNERRKDELRLQQDQKEETARKRREENEKKNAIKRIFIDTAINVIRSIMNNGGIPLGLPFGALAFAAGVTQAAAVKKLKDGEININGKGTSTSDSIPAMLSKGESVINAESTAHSPRLLEAINDRKIDDRILNQAAGNGGRQVSVFDDSGIIDAIERNQVQYEQHGYSMMKAQKIGKNFTLKMRSKIQGY